MGATVGWGVGSNLGTRDEGRAVRLAPGRRGAIVGNVVGMVLGADEGRLLGCPVGWLDGGETGCLVGCPVGCLDGWHVGCIVGKVVG